MSLVSTLGRLAVGMIVAKGVGKVLGGSRGRTSGGGGLGDMLGQVLGGGAAGGGLGSALGGVLGGGQSRGQNSGLGTGQGGGGLGGDLGALLGGKTDSQGHTGPAGGLGGLLEAIGGGGSAGGAAGGLGGLLNDALAGNQVAQAPPAAEAQAEVLIRAMVNAAKSDGTIDQNEQNKLLEHLGDVSAEEKQFVMNEMQTPLDVNGFVRSVPAGTEQQVYLMSLMAIDLDNQAEAQYLDQLRKGLNISEQACNSMHQQLGAPVLYS